MFILSSKSGGFIWFGFGCPKCPGFNGSGSWMYLVQKCIIGENPGKSIDLLFPTRFSLDQYLCFPLRLRKYPKGSKSSISYDENGFIGIFGVYKEKKLGGTFWLI